MAFRYLGPKRTEEHLKTVLDALAKGVAPRVIERTNVEIKEEPGRRDKKTGSILPGEARNENAAAYLLHELACLANTPEGGALILGVSDNGERLGTNLDPEWLRHRIYELSNRLLTVDIQVGELDGSRILILRVPEAIEPVRSKNKVYWRVADNCVEVDAASWFSGRLSRAGYDWSSQASGHTVADAKVAALEAARHFLKQAADESSIDLSTASDGDLLRRLNVVTPKNWLTNAGSLLFVTTPDPGIDYIRRDYSGGDSTIRILSPGPLLTQLAEVEQAAVSANPTIHVPAGLAHGQIRGLPRVALREAIVNGIVHRDWLASGPTVVEHTGNTLIVTSPGGFVPGISPDNIITHPSSPRYRSLASVISSLRLSEREGIGVDRMVAEMLAVGYPAPEIEELPGPHIRVALVGGTPDLKWMEFLNSTSADSISRDVDSQLLLDLLIRFGWFDVDRASPALQRSESETRAAIDRLEGVTHDGHRIISAVAGVPPSDAPAWRLSDSARKALEYRTRHYLSGDGRKGLMLDWAAGRNRVSSTEAADLAGISATLANTLLQQLDEEGLLEPSRPNRRGRGFFYRPAQTITNPAKD